MFSIPQDFSPFWISLKTALLATIVTFIVGLAAAYWMLGYRGRWKSLLEGLFVSPLILPPTVVGFLLLVLLGKHGPIGQLTDRLGWTIVFTWYAAVITAVVVSFPLMYRTVLGAFEQLDHNLLGVARTLGASEWTIFFRIVVPLSLPGILAGTMLAFARALGEFGATLMLAGNIPGQTQTIPMAIYFSVEAGAMSEAWFWAIVIMGISLSGIFAVNIGQQRQTHRPVMPVMGQSPPRHLATVNSPIPSTLDDRTSDALKHLAPVHLLVDLHKPLAGFTLEVSFNTDDRPLGLLGGSGAGKSMILRCIAGTETPQRGKIVLNGRVLFDDQQRINIPSRDRRIGFLVQNYALFPHMTVAQNIAFGLPKGLTKATIRQRVAAQLAAVELADLAQRYPHQLSGGQQQRVALARALASEPEALLLDEPFSALDTFLRSQIEQQMIRRLADYAGVTLFVTHNLDEAYRVCPHLLVLETGRTIAYGSKQMIFERPHSFRVAQLTGCKNFSQARAIADFTIEATDWGIVLQSHESWPSSLQYIGIRAHQIGFVTSGEAPNTFPVWLAATNETPHRMTVFLKFHGPASHPQDYHLQAEVFKEKWLLFKDRPLPWLIQLDPLKLMLLSA